MKPVSTWVMVRRREVPRKSAHSPQQISRPTRHEAEVQRTLLEKEGRGRARKRGATYAGVAWNTALSRAERMPRHAHDLRIDVLDVVLKLEQHVDRLPHEFGIEFRRVQQH